MTDQPSRRWAETVDTADGGATIRIPAYAPDGSETDGLLLTRADAIVLRNMLSSLLAEGTFICGTSPDPGIYHGGCNSGRASGGHCRCACGGGGQAGVQRPGSRQEDRPEGGEVTREEFEESWVTARRTIPKGECPTCGRTYRLKSDGTLRAHWARLPNGTAAPGLHNCPGTDRQPNDTIKEQR